MGTVQCTSRTHTVTRLAAPQPYAVLLSNHMGTPFTAQPGATLGRGFLFTFAHSMTSLLLRVYMRFFHYLFTAPDCMIGL